MRLKGFPMSKQFIVALEGVAELDSIGTLSDEIVTAARQAVNKTLDWGRAQAAREMREQVAFPASYLSGENGRLRVTRRATNADLEGVITGRQRPTSLARFSKTHDVSAARRRGGVNVQVKPGGARFMKGAFLMRLRQGNTLTDTAFNLGLAIRLKPGETLDNKKVRLQRADSNLYILYGPSVDQVFRTVAGDISPEAGERLEREFNRLLDLRK
jgi:hypothetical protein